MSNELMAYRGDTIPIEAVVSRGGSVLNITDATFTFSMKRWKTDTTPIVTKTVGDGIALTDPTNGVLLITISIDISKDLEGIFHYDIEMVESSGRKTTVAESTITLETDISQ